MTPQQIRALRESRGWSQQQLADRLGISQPAVSMMEAGERPVTRRTERQLEALRDPES